MKLFFPVFGGQFNISPINVKKDYPTIYEYLNRKDFKPTLQDRADQGDHWTNLRNCAYIEEFEKPKIMFQEIVQDGSFLYDEERKFCNDTGRIITGENLQYLLSILNSKLFFFCIKEFYGGGMLGGHGVRMKHTFFEKFPIKPITPELQKPLIALVDKILAAKGTSTGSVPGGVALADISKYEAEIDARVFHLYGLTEEEMLAVLNSFPKMNQEEKDLIVKFYREIEKGNLK